MFSRSQWAEATADRCLARLRSGAVRRLCLPAGRTPRPLYADLARRGIAERRLFETTEILMLDEFGVPRGHPLRCDGMVRRELIEPGRLDLGAFHHLEPDAHDLEAECRRYRELVSQGGLDLVLLGLGPNGHVGLNEPGSVPESETRYVELDPSTVTALKGYGTTGSAPVWGLTLGLREILTAQEVWLLVTGREKAAILARAVNGPITADVPASFLRGHPNVRVLADQAAAAEGIW